MPAEIYKQEGYRLMGAAFEVYNEQGYGMAEEICQESMEIELGLRAIQFEAKRSIRCHYKGRPLAKSYIPDLLVFISLLVELKAVTELLPEHEAQLFNYMRITHRPVGYLINFGHKDTLEWKRLIISEFVPNPGVERQSSSD